MRFGEASSPPASSRGALWAPQASHAYSQQLLEQLERANLFLMALDDERRWYRYHHLFSEVLRERLAHSGHGASVATLHRRASFWYEQQGLIAEAVQHALAAGAADQAARLVEQASSAGARTALVEAEQFLSRGGITPTWLVPPLGVHRARLALAQGDIEAATRWTELAGIGSEEDPRPGKEFEYLTLARLLLAQGQPVRAARLFGAADALAEQLGVARPIAGHRIIIERNMTMARAQLDEAMFAAEWAAGRAMTLEQAIAFALEEDQ